MINDHWVLTLLLGDAVSLVLLGSATVLGFRVARQWDANAASELQLVLERKSYLVSTIMTYVFGFEMLSLWLFVVTVNDHFPPLIKGAMCGTGSLNANQFGWLALLLKCAEFIALALWLFIHMADRRVPEYPLTREKFYALLLVAPLVFAAAVVQFLYFLSINPSIITTCCSVTFDSASGNGIASSFAMTVDEGLTVRLFTAFGIVMLVANALVVLGRGKAQAVGEFAVPVAGTIFAWVSLTAITHHYVKYVYGMPSHHCPFDMLWQHYYFIGYVIYGLLFLSLVSSCSVGIAWVVGRKGAMRVLAVSLARTAALWSSASTALLLGVLFLVERLWRAAA